MTANASISKTSMLNKHIVGSMIKLLTSKTRLRTRLPHLWSSFLQKDLGNLNDGILLASHTLILALALSLFKFAHKEWTYETPDTPNLNPNKDGVLRLCVSLYPWFHCVALQDLWIINSVHHCFLMFSYWSASCHHYKNHRGWSRPNIGPGWRKCPQELLQVIGAQINTSGIPTWEHHYQYHETTQQYPYLHFVRLAIITLVVEVL